MVAAAVQYRLSPTGRRPPELFVERRRRTHAHPPLHHVHALATQAGALHLETGRTGGKRDAAIGAHDAMPGKPVVTGLAQNPGHQPGPAGQSCATRDLAIGHYFTGRYRTDRVTDTPCSRVAVAGGAHGASIAGDMETPMRDYRAIRDYLEGEGYDIRLHDDEVMCVELSLENGQRHQALFLTRISDEDGRAYVRVSTAVAPMTGIDACRALAFNWGSQVGYLAIGDLDGVPHLQLCENRPLDGLELSEVTRLVLEIGGLGDRMERTLSTGGDLF